MVFNFKKNKNNYYSKKKINLIIITSQFSIELIGILFRYFYTNHPARSPKIISALLRFNTTGPKIIKEGKLKGINSKKKSTYNLN